MNARMTKAKIPLLAAGAAVLLLLGAGVAYATGSGGDASGQAAATNLDKAKSVALEQVNGRVTGTEVGDERDSADDGGD